MIFFDTNILVYSLTNLDLDKQTTSDSYIEKALTENALLVSPLIISELIFTLTKLKLDNKAIAKGLAIFSKCCQFNISKEITLDAAQIALDLNRGSSINDFIHLKFAERHCKKLLTFDSGFEQMKQFSNIEIEILKS